MPDEGILMDVVSPIPGVGPLVITGIVLGVTFIYAFIKIFLPMMGINLLD